MIIPSRNAKDKRAHDSRAELNAFENYAKDNGFKPVYKRTDAVVPTLKFIGYKRGAKIYSRVEVKKIIIKDSVTF